MSADTKKNIQMLAAMLILGVTSVWVILSTKRLNAVKEEPTRTGKVFLFTNWLFGLTFTNNVVLVSRSCGPVVISQCEFSHCHVSLIVKEKVCPPYFDGAISSPYSVLIISNHFDNIKSGLFP